MDFYSLLEYSQLKAIGSAIDPNAESIYRIRCREYSERFHTPLHVVMNELDPLFVLQNLYEMTYPPSIVEEEIEELMDILYMMKDPNYSKISKEDLEDLVDSVLNKEIKRLSKEKRPTEQTIKEVDGKGLPTKNVLPSKPKSGGLDFGNLEKLESMSERPGFKD